MAWRVARSLDRLLAQLNAAYPGRSKLSDGGIGDAAHASRSSDHNPWVKLASLGIVTARDYTHDPARGLDCSVLAAALIASGDSRIKYIIWNRRIWDRVNGWKAYFGINPHTKHLHLSVEDDPALYDNTRDWQIVPAIVTAKTTEIAPGVLGAQQALNFTGADLDGYWGAATDHRLNLVRLALNGSIPAPQDLQLVVGAVPDGEWGPLSQEALAKTVHKLQSAFGVESDGAWGPATQAAYEALRAKEYIS